MRSRKLAAASAFCVLAALGQSIPVNFPSLHGYRFVSIDLDGFPAHAYHVFEVKDHGVAVTMKGLLLERFLWAAGWDPERRPKNEISRYRVRVQGRGEAVTLGLDEILGGSLSKRAMLIRERNGKRVPWDDRPLLVVVDGDGTAIQTISGVLSVRVFE